MEVGTKLFPALFFEATSKEVLQFELGRTPTTLPLSAAVLQNSEKHVVPQVFKKLYDDPRINSSSLRIARRLFVFTFWVNILGFFQSYQELIEVIKRMNCLQDSLIY